MAAKKRDPEQVYSFGGQLYGKGYLDVALLDKKHPLKEEAEVEEPSGARGTATGTPAGNNPPSDGGEDGRPGLGPEEYKKADEAGLLAEVRRRGLEVLPGAKKNDMIKVLQEHDKTGANKPGA